MTIVRGEGRAPSRAGRVLASAVLVVVTLLASLWAYASPAVALAPPQATTCTGVWVVVDYGALGGATTTDCAAYTTGMTGMAALRGVAGVGLDAGMVVKIQGLPAAPNIQENYWSYWHSTRQADGSYSAWSYSNVGPSSYHPSAGQAEGWRYAPAHGAYVAPGVMPPKQAAAAQAPATAVPPTTAAAKATKATTGTTTASVAPPTPPVTATASSDSPSPAVGTSAGETPGGTPTTDPASGLTIAPSAHPANTAANSLMGGVIAIVVIGLGALGMLVWRRRSAAKT